LTAKSLQVLVVEDSPNDAELTVFELIRAGYTVEWDRVASEGEYLGALSAELDLILADYNLPQFSALRALHLLLESGLDVPFIVVTGSIEEVAIECMKQGASDYLLKDRLGRLGQAVERALTQKQMRDEKRRADASLQRHTQQLEALYKTSLEINAQLDVPSLLRTIVARAVDLLDSPMGGLYLVRADGKSLEMVVNHQMPNEYTGTILKLGEGLSGRVALSGKMLMVEDYRHWSSRALAYYDASLRRVLAVPLKLGERVLGVITICDDQLIGYFTDEQVRLAELFADQAAVAVENARLLEISQRELHERQRAEKALRESQRALATLMSNLPGMAYRGVYKPVWMMKFVSDGCLALTGYQPSELIENRHVAYENLIHPDDLPRLRREIETALQEDHPYQITYRIVTAKGEQRWVWEQGRGIFGIEEAEPKATEDDDNQSLLDDFDPSATGIFSVARVLQIAKNSTAPKVLQALEGFITDISSRIQAENALRDSEELFRQLAENVHDIFWVSEAGTGKLIYLSPAYDTVSGRSRLSLYHSLRSLLRGIYPDDRKAYRKSLSQYLNGQPVHGQFRIVRPDGAVRWVEARTYPIYNESQQVYRWVGVAEDITERKLAEDQLRQQTQRLQVLDSISRSLADILQDYHQVLESVVRQVAEFLGDACGITLFAEEENALRTIALHHIHADADVYLRSALAYIPLDDPLAAQLFSDGSPLMITHLEEQHAAQLFSASCGDYLERFGVSGVMAVVLRAQGKMLGAMMVFRGYHQPAYTLDDLSFLQELANRVALTVINSRLYAENLRRLDHMQALREIDNAISGSVDLQISLKVIVERAMSQLGVDAACVLTYNPYLLELKYIAAVGFLLRNLERSQVALGQSLAGRAILENQPISIFDLAASSQVLEGDHHLAEWMRAEGFVAYFARPLIAKGEVQGVLEVIHRSTLRPDDEWFDFLDALAGQAAIAINNANLLINLRRSNAELSLAYNETIQGWSHALDLRDHETEGHTQRVTEMTVRLARAMGFDGERLAHIRRGSLLHDIGKMGVRDDILLKPAKLNDAEWVEMRKHPVYAYNMLAPIAYLRPALDIPYCHHEWWNGNGYPRGLKGEEIPLEARIFAITDVWDAITWPRPYNPNAMPKPEAAEYIRARTGTHFDPAVVEKFFEVFGDELS
jgi:PAS domain S-box-containing protein